MGKALFAGDIGVKVHHRDRRGQNQILGFNGARCSLGYPGHDFVGEKGLHLNPCNRGLKYRGNPGLMLADPEQPADFQRGVGFTEKKLVSGNFMHFAGHLKWRSILLFEKGYQPGEGFLSGLSLGCGQKKRQQAG